MIQADDLKVNALVKAGLLIGSPLDQANLVQSVAAPVIPRRIVNRYNSPSYVRCAVCSTDDKHLHGVTLELSNGKLALSGLVCARKHFGNEVIKRIENSFKLREKQAIADIQRVPLLLALVDAKNRLDPEWSEFEQSARASIRALEDFIPKDDMRIMRHDSQSLRLGFAIFERQFTSISFCVRSLREMINLLDRASVGPKVLLDCNKRRLTIVDALEDRRKFVQDYLRFWTSETLKPVSEYLDDFYGKRIILSDDTRCLSVALETERAGKVSREMVTVNKYANAKDLADVAQLLRSALSAEV